MGTGVIPSPPGFLPSIFIAHRVQQSHCSSIVHRVLLTHALALSASQFVHKRKSQRMYTSMHSAGLELTKLTYPRLHDNLIRHRGDRLYYYNTPGTICTYHHVLRCWITMHAQLRSVRLYIAQQRSVAPCGAVRSHAVRCRALRCGAVSCCAVCFLSNIEQYLE